MKYPNTLIHCNTNVTFISTEIAFLICAALFTLPWLNVPVMASSVQFGFSSVKFVWWKLVIPVFLGTRE